ncbi:hypothetical protein HDU97_008396 [Phlyctochytrium planicorne]|nr:hypothetical protein HDU97_008396 [Phlyctochytrium planicorne]
MLMTSPSALTLASPSSVILASDAVTASKADLDDAFNTFYDRVSHSVETRSKTLSMETLIMVCIVHIKAPRHTSPKVLQKRITDLLEKATNKLSIRRAYNTILKYGTTIAANDSAAPVGFSDWPKLYSDSLDLDANVKQTLKTYKPDSTDVASPSRSDQPKKRRRLMAIRDTYESADEDVFNDRILKDGAYHASTAEIMFLSVVDILFYWNIAAKRNPAVGVTDTFTRPYFAVQRWNNGDRLLLIDIAARMLTSYRYWERMFELYLAHKTPSLTLHDCLRAEYVRIVEDEEIRFEKCVSKDLKDFRYGSRLLFKHIGAAWREKHFHFGVRRAAEGPRERLMISASEDQMRAGIRAVKGPGAFVAGVCDDCESGKDLLIIDCDKSVVTTDKKHPGLVVVTFSLADKQLPKTTKFLAIDSDNLERPCACLKNIDDNDNEQDEDDDDEDEEDEIADNDR